MSLLHVATLPVPDPPLLVHPYLETPYYHDVIMFYASFLSCLNPIMWVILEVAILLQHWNHGIVTYKVVGD
jgi:hypothetical protein